MKYTKPFLAPLVAGLFIANAAYANNNEYNIDTNQIPVTMMFHLNHPNERGATLTFQNSALPVKVSCYFASTPKGLNAFFSSDQDNITFMPGTDETLNSGTNEVKIFTVTSAKNNQRAGKINITISGNDARSKTATLICMMRK